MKFATINSPLELRLYAALKRITQYQTVANLRRYAVQDYGVDGNEAVEYAYENVIWEAKAAIKGVRLPKATSNA